MKIMKTISQTFLAGALMLALAFTATDASAQVMKNGKATVRALHGDVKYTMAGSAPMKLKVNQTLMSGVTIIAPADGWADLSVNGNHSTVRVTPGSTLKIDDMEYLGSTTEGDTKTTLNLQSGTVLGNVKKLSASSDYDIRTPNGVAGIRGTDFAVVVEKLPDGNFRVTFTSVVGQLVCAAIIPNVPNAVTKVLNDGQSWTPGSDVQDTPADLIKRYAQGIPDAMIYLNSLPPTSPGTPVTINPPPSPGTGTSKDSQPPPTPQ